MHHLTKISVFTLLVTVSPNHCNKYKNVEIFRKDASQSLKPGVAIGPVMVGLEEGLLDDEEIAVLCRGPKFCVRRMLDEERFLVECEKSYFKVPKKIVILCDQELTSPLPTLMGRATKKITFLRLP